MKQSDVIQQMLRILILEDQIADAELCQAELRRAGLRFTAHRVETRAEFESTLDEFRPDLIISDFTLPGAFDGLTALELARTRFPDIPFVFVSGTIGEERAVEAIKHGAADYVLKDRMARLGPAVSRVLEGARLRREKEQAEAALKANEALYRGIFEGSAEGILLSTLNGYLLAANPAAARMLGYSSPEELESSMTNPGYRLYAEPDVRRMFIERVKREEEVHGYETRGLRKDGTPLWVSLSARLVRDQQGGMPHILTMISDITERKQAEAARRESEERFRQITENIREVFWLTDPSKNELLYVSPAYDSIWERPGAALYTSPQAWLEAIHPEDRERVLHAAIHEQAAGTYDQEYRIVRPDGTVRWIHDRAFPVRDMAGKVYRIAGVAEDITERKLQEQKIERLSRIRILSSGINAIITRSVRTREIFEGTCRLAVQHGGFGIAWIGTLDARTLEVTQVAWAGLEAQEFLGPIKSSARSDHPRGQGVMGRAIREKAPVFSNDLSQEDGPIGTGTRRNEAMRRGYSSRIALPLLTKNEIAGVIVLYAREKDFFNEEELKLLSELAGNIALALENMAGQQKIEKLSRVRAVTSEINAAIVRFHNRQELLDEACRIAVEHGKFGLAWIGTFNPAAMEVTPVAWAGVGTDDLMRQHTTAVRPDTPRGQGNVGRAIRERKPAYSNEIEPGIGGKRLQEMRRLGYRSVIALPLLSENTIAGVVVLFAKEPGFFTDEEVKLLSELAGNISFALEHIARQQKIEKLSRVRTIMSAIDTAIVRANGLDRLLTDACRIAVEQGGFELAWIGSCETAKGDILPVAWAGTHAEKLAKAGSSASSDNPLGTGVTGRAIREKAPVFVNELMLEPDIGSERRREVVRLGYHSSIGLPLIVDGRAVGALTLYVREPDFFDEEEVGLLSELAGNISFGMETIAKQHKIAKLSRIRSVSSELNAAIVRIHDQDALLGETCRIMDEHGGFELAWIGFVDQDSQTIRSVAWSGFTAEVVQTLNWANIGASQGALKAAVSTRKPYFRKELDDGRPAGLLRQAAITRGFRSSVCLPLEVDGKVVAVALVFAREPAFFDEDELALLTELAADVSLALQTIARQEKLDYLSYYDPLTGLPNRALFMDRAGQKMRTRNGEALMTAMILLNIERFRNINETHGRHGGDDLLRQVTRRLENAFHGKDQLAHLSADSFGVVIRGIRDTAAAVHVLQDQVLECFREPFNVNGSELRVAAKAGIAMFPADGENADTLFNNAEAALKQARQSGERYLFYASDMNARAAQVLSLETRLRKAVESREFVLHYQPKCTLADGRICGMEALIRWQDPLSGLVPPGTFIPLLEETGLILDVGKWALGQALAQHREWMALGCTPPRIAVNVSAIQLQQKDFSDIVIDVVQEQGDNPDALELEVTESLLMKDVQASIRKLSILRGLGITIAMDDFGTGYSSLAYIARLPINSLKIDRSFITGMAGSPQDMGIVTTIITLAHSMNLKVVAEGVETAEQSQLLKLLKCDEAQGYLFGKPLPPADIAALLLGRASQQPLK